MTAIFIQARTGSTRLPNKVMKLIDDIPIIKHVVDTCRQVFINTIVLIPKDDPLRNWLIENHIPYYEGSETDLVSRYYNAALTFQEEFFVRITSDCPLLPADTLAFMVNVFQSGKFNFMTNAPCVDGHDIEIADFHAIKWIHENAKEPEDREHVFKYLNEHTEEFNKTGMVLAKFKSAILPEWIPKLSIDTQEDLDRVRVIYKKLKEL